MNVVLEKYHGLGNDYLVFDPNKNEMELNEENVRLLCDRNYGIGAEGILRQSRWVFESGIQMEARQK